MKKEMKTEFKSSIFSVDRNITIIKAANQDSFVTKTTSVERILTNQNRRRSSVTISCQSFSQMIIKEARIDKRDLATRSILALTFSFFFLTFSIFFI